MKRLILAIAVLGCIGVNAESNQPSFWQDVSQSARSISSVISNKSELKHRRLLLNEASLRSQLENPISDLIAARSITNEVPKATISLPLPDGSFVEVVATPSQVISNEMSEAYPNLKTWNVIGVANPKVTGVIDFTDNGFSGMLMMPDGDTVFIDPDKDQTSNLYKAFSKNENADSFHTELNCALHDDHDHTNLLFQNKFSIKEGSRSLSDVQFPNIAVTGTKTYRLALSGTAEYTDSQGGTAGARSSMVTSVNRINPIFTRDLGVSLELIDAPDLIFSDNANDPFSDPNNPSTLMIENGEYLSDQNRLGEFDLGHVLSHNSNSGGSGVAFLGVACRDDVQTSNLGLLKGLKAAGATTSSNPTGSTFDLVLLAHELGHQLGANHSYNSNQSSCGYGRTGDLAVEPGSGSTIMSYAGLCGSDNLLENPRDDFFHFASISQINSYTRLGPGANCGVDTSTGTVPTADAGADVNIPANTPFVLEGTAPAGTTSSWDQIDVGAASSVDVDTGDNAIIRHNIPTEKGDRYIPSLSDLFSGTSTIGELLPTTTRELNFAYVVRNEYGVATDRKLINVEDTNSQFSVISQDTAQTITADQPLEVIWNPANTQLSPINCSHVDIQLIRENGSKNMLLASTPNDATETLTVPASIPSMSNARIFVGCSDSAFFNISAGSITVENTNIQSDTTNPVITILGTNPVSIVEGSVYNDAGATATDDIDGTVSVTSAGNVDTDTVGSYTVTYTAVDTAGNSESVTRTVNVTAAPVSEEDITPEEPATEEPTPTNGLGQGPTLNETQVSGGGGGSFGFMILPVLMLVGIRRLKPFGKLN